jgi:hypothetical protein
MTSSSHIAITALVSDRERAIVEQAGEHLTLALGKAGDKDWTCTCTFHPDRAALVNDSTSALRVTSLLPEAESSHEPWAEVESRLRASYAALARHETPVFICTVFRHVGEGAEPAREKSIRDRIHRLNLLAAEISRETSAFVIDLDRVLADVGARNLETDYRLSGQAREMAAHTLALTVLTNGLDALAPFELQDAAREILANRRPIVAATSDSRAATTLPKNMLAVGRGRRRQVVSPVGHTVEEKYSEWLVRRVIKGDISAGEALLRLMRAIRRRGLRGSAALLASGLSRQFQRKA